MAWSTTCVCANLQFLVLKVPEGEGWDRIWGLDGGQPRVFVRTSTFWCSRSQKVRVGTESGGWTAVNHVCLCQPPLSGPRGPRRFRLWGLPVGRPSTTCVCANLQFLVLKVPEGGGWDRIWGLGGRQPRAFVRTSTFWCSRSQKVGVGTESGGWTAVNHVCLCQPPLSGPRSPRGVHAASPVSLRPALISASLEDAANFLPAKC